MTMKEYKEIFYGENPTKDIWILAVINKI